MAELANFLMNFTLRIGFTKYFSSETATSVVLIFFVNLVILI